MDSAKDFWNRQTSSLHRADGDFFYRRKAAEHAGLIPDAERQAGAIDIGCGAGELLYFFSHLVRVDTGLDYSQSMLAEAARRLEGKPIQLLDRDLFDYLPPSSHPVWLTTGAINQYLAPDDLRRFLDVFRDNAAARSLYLFDCVDPIRYLLVPYGLSYRPPVARDIVRKVYHFGRRAVIAAGLALGVLGRPSLKLPGAGMGYGFLPKFWFAEAAARGLQAEIVGSQAYEYRYHVILRKPVAANG